MPSSCSPSLSPDVALFPGSAGPLDAGAQALALPTQGAAAEGFDALLVQEGVPVASVAGEGQPVLAAPAPLSAEQLAFLAALAMPVPQAPVPVEAAPVSGECRTGWVRTDATGKSLAELLGQGVDRIAYKAVATPEGASASPTVALASEAAAAKPAATPAATMPTATQVQPQPEAEAMRRAGKVFRPMSQENGSAAVRVPAPAAATVPAATFQVSAAPASPSAEYALPSVLESAAAQTALISTPAVPNAAGGLAKPRAARPGLPTTEKIAASGSSPSPAGGFSSIGNSKMHTEVALQEQLAVSPSVVGTSAANWGKLMPQDSRTLLDYATQTGTPATVLDTGATALGTKATTEAASQTASQAMEMIREIRDIADGLWQVERNSVEVEFDFGARERLSVRVEYRDGVVQATFKTDSAELRDAIAREWQQSPGHEARPYRVADPVFTSSGFSFSGDASRHQRSQEQAVPFDQTHAFVASRGGAATPSSPTVPAPVQRQASTGHLHAIV